jgi:HSP20 family protein
MLEKYDPFRNLQLLSDALSRAFEDFPFGSLEASRATTWAPRVDVWEDSERILFKFDVPDVRKEDLTVRVENGVLTVEGQRKLEYEEKRNNYHRIERSYGKFARSFSLPDTVSHDKVDAELKDGVLRITLLKRAEMKPRTIEVKAA